jgi:hypothetical protein
MTQFNYCDTKKTDGCYVQFARIVRTRRLPRRELLNRWGLRQYPESRNRGSRER